ncbi:BZIP family transcription factor [Purpureocillium lavendulum]|uniref:BZIP family transcription factor n=1 Tax=Purpureocillium lavendulum TaxID=1247861 RepID=A0AB34FKG5_9HYPO|nr:BZIP family transcription factor [Purpureocillium lavendulum]
MQATTDLPILGADHYDIDGLFPAEQPPPPRKAPKSAKRAAPATGKRSKPADAADVSVDGNDNDDEEGRKKRSRGRPRLDTKDETAADRRRTQIRLAQRAYRHRKDTAISSLEQKVKDLEKANAAMSQEFGDFYKLLMTDGGSASAPQVAFRLKSMADRLLSPSTTQDGSASSNRSPSADTDDQPGPRFAARQNSGSSSEYSRVEGPSVIPHHQYSHGGSVDISPTAPAIHMPSSLSYEVVTQPTPSNASFPFYASMEPTSPHFIGHLASPDPYASLPPPSTFAPHEITFGRRVQRATLEAGLRLISMPNPPPERYAAVFGFCLFFESRDAIIRRLQLSISRTRQEGLSHWKAPFTNLGGAGTFFLDKSSGVPSADGSDDGSMPIGNQGTREYFRPPEMTGFSMGPFSADVEATRDDRLDHRMRMLYPGFEGNFFDADEVETYLRNIGITIPQSADFVEADVNVDELQDDSSPVPRNVASREQSAFGGGGSMLSSDSGYGSIDSGHVGTASWGNNSPGSAHHGLSAADLQSNTRPMANMLHNTVTTGSMDFPNSLTSFICPPGLEGMWQSAPSWSRAKVTVNVNVLVNELVGTSVCLGRTPGVRRKDVNRAVKIATGLVAAH